MSKSNILFIINPISGGKNKQKIPALIEARLDHTKFDPSFAVTEYVGHAAKLADEAIARNVEVIVAVGGDGTINEIASAVIAHQRVMGIIPFGSGNGLARFLGIPMNPEGAVSIINAFHIRKIDTGTFNGKSFFNMAGMGFDAHVSSVFAGDKSRGFSGYLKLGLKEILSYRPEHYRLEIDGTHYEREAVVLSIANSSQYGNNAHISPMASITDGLLDVCILKQFPLYKLPVLAYEMFGKKTSDLIEVIRGKEIRILREREGSIHIDGEPYVMGREIKISVAPLSLNIISP